MKFDVYRIVLFKVISMYVRIQIMKKIIAMYTINLNNKFDHVISFYYSSTNHNDLLLACVRITHQVIHIMTMIHFSKSIIRDNIITLSI